MLTIQPDRGWRFKPKIAVAARRRLLEGQVFNDNRSAKTRRDPEGEMRSRLQSVAPIMPTTDITRTKAHYERLGFVVHVHDDFVMTERDDVELFFALNAEHDPSRTAACIYVRVTDADLLHAEWKAAGVTLKPLHHTDYGSLEFNHIDPDNNLITFASR